MRRLVVALCVLIMAATAWAAPITLTVVNSGNMGFPEGEDFRGYASINEKIAGDFEKAHPGVKVTIIVRDQKQGSLPVDAMMAKGTPPDVWLDAEGYFANYLNAEYAVPLEKYIDTKIFQKDLIEKFSRNGHVYALPEIQVAGGFAINLDMLDAIGYKLPEQKDWTTDEFLNLGAKLKSVGIPLTMIMGKGGFNTWDNVWLFAFGAEFFKNRDYSKTTINSKEAVTALDYIKKLIDLGYAYPNPVEVNDDDGVELYTTAKVFSCMMQNGHADGWIPAQIKAGKLAKAFKYTFIEVPHAPGRAHTPVYGYQLIAVGHATKDEARNKLVAELTAVVSGKEMQYYNQILSGGFPTIINWAGAGLGMASIDSYKAISKLPAQAGYFEEFPANPKGAECKRIWRTMTESFVRGKMTAQQMLAQFEVEANKILAAK
jgi:ABC-type glycerol-3-phosphate transport system substrate-binding protein